MGTLRGETASPLGLPRALGVYRRNADDIDILAVAQVDGEGNLIGSSGGTAQSVDVTDRAARVVGVVTQGPPGNSAWPMMAYVPTNIVYTAPAGTVINGNGTSTTINTGSYSTWACDISVTAITGGVGPTVQFYVDRQGSDGVWYQVWTSGVISAPGTASTTIGRGMAVAHDLGTAARLRWAFGGTTPPTSVTFSSSVIAK